MLKTIYLKQIYHFIEIAICLLHINLYSYSKIKEFRPINL